ncbi:hypothetical protein R1sor_015262 [Riccia sorocarpa]|uniref:Uncharacterized protein n=1 Tax=Riccia sorocarpa TaxID=122646 RepID=A0ABD3HBR3_9MARC
MPAFLLEDKSRKLKKARKTSEAKVKVETTSMATALTLEVNQTGETECSSLSPTLEGVLEKLATTWKKEVFKAIYPLSPGSTWMDEGQTSIVAKNTLVWKEKYVKLMDQVIQLHRQLMELKMLPAWLNSKLFWKLINGVEVPDVKLAEGLAKIFKEHLTEFGVWTHSQRTA